MHVEAHRHWSLHFGPRRLIGFWCSRSIYGALDEMDEHWVQHSLFSLQKLSDSYRSIYESFIFNSLVNGPCEATDVARKWLSLWPIINWLPMRLCLCQSMPTRFVILCVCVFVPIATSNLWSVLLRQEASRVQGIEVKQFGHKIFADRRRESGTGQFVCNYV